MRVFFIRHGIAVPRGAPGVIDDASRELTRDGIARMGRQARGLASLGLRPSRIWTSPLVRARQTADLLAESLGRPGTVRPLTALAPGDHCQAILDTLARHTELEEVALVGHEPGLSETVTRLLTGMATSALQLKKGGAACVQIDDFTPPVRGQLCWLLTPRQLRDLA